MLFGKKPAAPAQAEATAEETPKQHAQKSLKRMNAWMAFGLIGIVATSAYVFSIFAAQINNQRDQMSNQATTATSNHDFSFSLSGGNTFTSAEQFAVDFPETSAFSTAGTWATGDFTFNDGTARVIDAVNEGPGVTTVSCSDGVNNIGVAIDTAAVQFRFIPCGGSFTSSGAGAFISFSIDGAGGDGQIVNPATTGSYIIEIIDGAGDCQTIGEFCDLAVSIVDTNDIQVTAQVNGGGGGGGGGGDTTPPVISNIHTENADEDSVEVCWDTNEPSSSVVNYGTTNTYGSQDTSPGLPVSHCVEIGPLVEGQEYHYQVCSTDLSNNQACSGDQTYTLPDLTPPLISGVTVNSVTCTSANFTWTTNEPATTYVDRGLVAGPPYANSNGNATPVTTHNLLITGLAQGTTYHYRVRSGDTGGNEAFTSDATFATAATCEVDTTAPVITNIQENNITQTTAQICWDTDEIANGTIAYGPTTDYGSVGSNPNFVTTRCINLSGLTPGTVYHYQLSSADPSGNTAITLDMTFTTVSTVPGECIVDCSNAVFNPYIINPDGTTRKVGSIYVQEEELSPTETQYNFEDKGSDFDYNDVIVTVNRDNCSAVTFSADLGDASWHHVIRAEVFYNGVLAKDVLLWSDSHNAENAPITMDFMGDEQMCEGSPPSISNVQVTNISENSALVTWDTLGTPSDSRVEYGLSAGYGSVVYVDENVTQHAVYLTGLSTGTLYHFRVSSEDNAGRSAQSLDLTFTTAADNIAPANVGSLSAVAGDGVVNLSWTNPPDADFAGVMIRRSTTGYPSGPSDGDLVYTGTGTSFADTGRTNGVQYFYAVFAYDEVPNYSSGALANATPVGAADVLPPANVTDLEAVAGNAQVFLTWTNPADADFQGVRIVRKIGSAPSGLADGTLVYDGPSSAFMDTGVVNDTQYFYRVFSYDEVPNYSSGAIDDATPSVAADTTPPAPVTDLEATPGDAMVLLTWTNPSTTDWAGTIILRKTGSYPTGPTDGIIVYDGTGASKMDNFVTNGTRYYYAAFAYDAVPNYAPAATDDATPLAGLTPPTEPTCSDSDGGVNYDTAGTVTHSGGSASDSCASATAVSENSCSNDQLATETHECGAGFKCSTGACVPDTFVPSTEVCGNSFCGGNENSLNCAIDCPVVMPGEPVVPTEPTVDPSERMDPTDLRFYATSGRIQLRLSGGDTLTFYRASVFTVMIPDPAIIKPIRRATITFDGRAYAMRQTASFEAAIITPDRLDTIPMVVAVEYEDGDTDAVTVFIRLIDRPRVLDSQTGEPIPGARVTLQTNESGNFGVWEGDVFGQANPQFTDEQGRFAYIVNEGSYRLIVEKDGYLTKTTLPFPNTTENVIDVSVNLIPLPPPDDIVAQVEFVAEVIVDRIGEIIENAYVEEGAGIAAPAATIATVANVAAAGLATASVFFLPSYLLSLLAHPFMLIARRRRKQWGTVYNSLSKLPIDLAIVRLIDGKTGRILRSAVTDKAGRYFFIVPAGSYKIVAVKAQYVFPSDVLRGMKEDNKYVDLYHGEMIAVSAETTITANIPLDPVGAEKTPSRVYWEGFLRRAQRFLGLFAIAAMVVATVITPTPLMFALLIGNVVMYLLFRRMAVTRTPKNWGIVYDEKSRKPLQNVVARIFDAKYNKLLETQVTDVRGRYAFLVGQNTYYVTFEKLGYSKAQKGPVDLVDESGRASRGAAAKTQTHLVAVDVPLVYTGKKASSMPHVPGPGAPTVPPAAPVPPVPPVPPPKIPPMPPQPASLPPKGDYAAQMLARLGGAGAPKTPSKTPPSETPEQLLKDIADEISGARNGHELPSPDKAHPDEFDKDGKPLK